MSDKVTFKKEVNCLPSDIWCQLAYDRAISKMKEQYDDLSCRRKFLADDCWLVQDRLTLICTGRPNARRQEMIKSVTFFGEFANKLFMAAITSIVDGALKLIGAK